MENRGQRPLSAQGGGCATGTSARGTSALLIGTESSRRELRPALARAGFTIHERTDLPRAAGDCAIVCVALDHPDQFPADDVRRFVAAFANARIICSRSPWCASMLRSRNDWPPAVVVDSAEFERRFESEKQVLHGQRPPLPITAGLEEIAAFNRPAGGALACLAIVGDWLFQIGLTTLLLAGLALHGCGNSGTPTKPEPSSPKPAWGEQVQGVRDGTSRKISARPASRSDWDQLKTGCGGLEVLEIEGETPPDLDFSVLNELSALRRLRIENGLNDAQAAALSGHPALSELLLSSESLTDTGLKALCRLPLVQLRLRAPQVTDAAMVEVGTLSQLRFLHLIDVPITDVSLPEFAKLESLESFYLDRAKCTDEGLSALLKQRPGLHFHRDQTHLRDDPKKHEH